MLAYFDSQRKLDDGHCKADWRANEMLVEEALEKIEAIEFVVLESRNDSNGDKTRSDFRVTIKGHKHINVIVDAECVKEVSEKDVAKLVRGMKDQRAVGGSFSVCRNPPLRQVLPNLPKNMESSLWSEIATCHPS